MIEVVDLNFEKGEQRGRLRRFLLVALAAFGNFSAIEQLEANPGDYGLSQRTGYVNSKGDLSRDKNHIAVMLAATRSFSGPKQILGFELFHRFALLYDTFYTRDEISLYFPLIPRAQVRLVEPSVELEGCLFATIRIHPCAGVGFSAVYLQSSMQNYQIYSSFPAEVRLVYATPAKNFFFEAGARYRGFQNRVEGFVARHRDLMPFVGFGLLFSSR